METVGGRRRAKMTLRPRRTIDCLLEADADTPTPPSGTHEPNGDDRHDEATRSPPTAETETSVAATKTTKTTTLETLAAEMMRASVSPALLVDLNSSDMSGSGCSTSSSFAVDHKSRKWRKQPPRRKTTEAKALAAAAVAYNEGKKTAAATDGSSDEATISSLHESIHRLLAIDADQLCAGIQVPNRTSYILYGYTQFTCT